MQTQPRTQIRRAPFVMWFFRPDAADPLMREDSRRSEAQQQYEELLFGDPNDDGTFDNLNDPDFGDDEAVPDDWLQFLSIN